MNKAFPGCLKSRIAVPALTGKCLTPISDLWLAFNGQDSKRVMVYLNGFSLELLFHPWPANVSDRQMSQTGKCPDRQMSRPAEVRPAKVQTGKCRPADVRPADVKPADVCTPNSSACNQAFFCAFGPKLRSEKNSDNWRNSANFRLNSANFLKKLRFLKLSDDLY